MTTADARYRTVLTCGNVLERACKNARKEHKHAEERPVSMKMATVVDNCGSEKMRLVL